MMDCIFCKLASGEIPTDAVYEDEEMIAFGDMEPQAPVHVLIIPKRHIASLDAVSESAEDKELLGHILSKVHVIAEKLGLENGYRLVANTGRDANQTVQHIHFHLLGGRSFGWPPG
ncbi:MAG: histidine triad nucleotide-binding protein [Clostridiales Family XIII bacterium]|nr:histidine triad nucleotide-binding protein [Clostridiales Family XIII bacterium]